ANGATLPSFFDFSASDGSEFAVNTTLETRTFSLAFGQHTSVLADGGFMYIGTLGVGGEDFIHLTVESKQDSITWDVSILDPEGRYLASYSGSGGNIWTIPFKPSVPGTYYVLFGATPSVGTFGLFDFLPVGVSATPIALGEIVSGKLPSSEVGIDPETGSLVQQEKAPTTLTYRVDSPTDVASLAYAFNYGGLFDTQPEYIIFTSGAFVYTSNGGSRYVQSISSPQTGEYFYRGGPYYVTVMGGDNTEFTLYNKVNSNGDLPLNHEFEFDNYAGVTTTQAYRLNVEEPSMLRVNSTAGGGDLSIRLTGVDEDGFRSARTISFAVNLQLANEYYLPKGDYFVEMIVQDSVDEWIEFNFGPLVTETTADIVRVGGFLVDTDIFQMYNMTLFLNNEDNVTVEMEVAIYENSGSQLINTGITLANRWDGSQVTPLSPYGNNATINYPYQSWYEGQAFVSICAYIVSNNTVGATNHYEDYPVNLTVQWMNMDDQFYADFETLDVMTAAASTNITLLTPPTLSEQWGVRLNTTPGVWYNVSVMTGGLSDFGAGLWSFYAGKGHFTGWGDLDDSYVGSLSEFSFQFGAISDTSLLDLYLSRNPVDGFVWIQITPMETHQLGIEHITPVGPDLLAILGSIAIPVAVGVGVIVVVYIIYVKKYK
ncbi:MAG: hypothetical protein ACFFCP_10735, partial [Promethearchaeota archaeon]